jgi:hypothetical protein
MPATKAILVKLLIEARKLDNETVVNDERRALWRLAMDCALEGEAGDSPEDLYITEGRTRHRRLVKSLFGPRW